MPGLITFRQRSRSLPCVGVFGYDGRVVRVFILAACVVAAAGSSFKTKEFLCSVDTECPGEGGYGKCVKDHCAFKAPECASGWRYDETAGDVAELCVPVSDLEDLPDAGPDIPDATPATD